VTDVSPIQPADDGVHLHIKAVPGASRDQIAGRLGSELKVRIAAAPEGGKANKAIARLIADAFSINRRDVLLVSGSSAARKVLLIRGLDVDAARRRLADALEAAR